MAGNRSLGALTLDLIARVGGFTSGLSKAEREAQRRARGIQSAFKGMNRVIAGTFAALGGSALIGSVVRNTVAAEQELAQLSAALKSTGEAAGFSRDQLISMANEFAKVSTNSAGEILQAETRLLSYTSIVGEQFPAAMQAAIDQSARLGMSLTQSAEIIGRALETPSKGVASLSKQGFQFSEEQKKLLKSLEATGRMAEAQAIVLDVLQESYGGAARAARDTFGGALASVRNSFDDLLTAEGGISDATAALNEFAELLRDPATKEGANSLASAIVASFTGATKAIVGTANVTKFLAEELASRIFGPAADDLVRLSDEIARIDEIMRSSPLTDSNWLGRLRLNPFDIKMALVSPAGALLDGIEWWSDEELTRHKEQLTRTLEAAYEAAGKTNSATTGPAGAGLPSVAPPSDEFLKLEAQLRQQIAMYGQLGEAAKIAYQIQSGQLDELSKAEQQRVLSLARQYDALVANAQAEKELEAARKRLEETFQNQVRNYEEQLALTGEITELERIRYEISKGGLKGIQADQAAYLESLAKQIDLEKLRADMQDRVKAIIEETMTPLERYNKTIEDLNKLREESIALLGEEGLSYEAYARAVAKAQEEFEKATHVTNEYMLEAARNTQNIIADTLVNGFKDGTKGILKAFGDMIVQLTAQAVAADLAKKLFGDPQSASSSGGWVGAAMNWFGSFAGRAAGGAVSAGMTYRVNEVEPEYFRPSSSGEIIPLSKMGGVGNQITNNFNISAPNGTMSMQTRQQLMADVARGIALANRRNN